MSSRSYCAWKRELVVAAFRARGLEVDVAPLIAVRGKRRRAVLAVERRDGAIIIGFHRAASHDVVAIRECPVLEPKIEAAMPSLANLVAPLVSKAGELRLVVCWTRSGLDVIIEGTERRLTPEIRGSLAAQATKLGLARLMVGGDIVCEVATPFLTFGNADVVLPPGAFAQAVAAAEREMAQHVVNGVGKAKSVADLFCGLGAFTFPLAVRARVLAFDGDREAIAALASAARKTSGLKPIEAQVRDLFREPLSPIELIEHDAILFDPPRAGAEAQAKKLAQSKCKAVVAVSCNPATLARDARHLVDGGYCIESVTPIDQFLYSPHVEVVVVFRR
jgi:23S rRNA (uracil1939-C5)-methyltransferase